MWDHERLPLSYDLRYENGSVSLWYYDGRSNCASAHVNILVSLSLEGMVGFWDKGLGWTRLRPSGVPSTGFLRRATGRSLGCSHD